jgi:hypothetical protein
MNCKPEGGDGGFHTPSMNPIRRLGKKICVAFVTIVFLTVYEPG